MTRIAIARRTVRTLRATRLCTGVAAFMLRLHSRRRVAVGGESGNDPMIRDLGAGGITVWCWQTTSLVAADRDRIEAVLSDDERERRGRLHRAADRRDFGAAHA